MNGILDGLLVGLVLLAGFGYASYSLGPKSWRARLLLGVAALFGHLPLPGSRRVAARAAAAAGRSRAACGGCDNCGAGDAAGARDVAPEIKVPLSQIGRRR